VHAVHSEQPPTFEPLHPELYWPLGHVGQVVQVPIFVPEQPTLKDPDGQEQLVQVPGLNCPQPALYLPEEQDVQVKQVPAFVPEQPELYTPGSL